MLGVASAWGAAAPNVAPAPAPQTLFGREAPELLRDVHLEAHTSPDSLTVGDRLILELSVDAPHGVDVRFPDTVPANDKSDLLERSITSPADAAQKGGGKAGANDTGRAADGRDHWTARYTLAVFGVGDVALAPWRVTVRADSLYAVASTDSIRITVDTVLTDSLAQAKIRDLKPQEGLPLSQWPWIVAGIAAVVLAVALVWWLRRRRRPQAAIIPLVRQRPADEVALEALRRLETQRLTLDGKFKEHYVALSEILRRYLEDGFGVAALEETTAEMCYDLGRHGFDRAHVQQIRDLSDEADLVKFAKFEPSIEDAVRAIDRGRDVVKATCMRMTVGAAVVQAAAAGSGVAVGGPVVALPAPPGDGAMAQGGGA